MIKPREEKNPGNLLLGIVMRDEVGVRGWSRLIWTPILRRLRKELGGSKTQHLNLSIVFLLGEGKGEKKREKKDDSSSLMVLN